MKGISVQAGLPIGGIFQSATEFDPFSLAGYFRGSISPTTVDNTTLSTLINAMASGAIGSVGYIVAVGNRSGAGAKCVYLINTSDNSVSDQQANVDSSLLLNGAAIYQGYFIYADGNDAVIKSAVFGNPLSSDTAIEVPSNMQVAYQPVVFFIGSDGYLYYLRGVSNGQVGRIAVGGSNHANNIESALIVQSDLTPKDGCHDGRYTIVIADSNPARATGINADCKVFFWDTASSTWNLSYTIPDQYLISCRFVNGVVRIIGYSGIWECAIGMTPRLVRPLTSVLLPTNPYMVTVNKDIMYWAAAGATQHVLGYGNLFGGKPILFTPYDSSSSSDLNKALVASGDYFYAATDAPKVVAHNYGATRANPTVQTIDKHLPQPYQLSHVKVTFKSPLSSGQGALVGLADANGTTISEQVTKSFSTVGAKRSLIFKRKSSAGAQVTFDNFTLTVAPQSGAVIERVAVYGWPVDDISQLT